MNINDFVDKVGVDKVLHFSIGGLISAFFTIILVLQEPDVTWNLVGLSFIGTIIVGFFSLCKEFMDIKVDWKDIVASILGTIPVIIATILGILLHINY